MTPWSWYARELDDDVYGLVCEAPTREAVIAEASRYMKPGEKFEIIEARSSTDAKYEGADFVPFLRTRNHEIVTAGREALRSEGESTTPVEKSDSGD